MKLFHLAFFCKQFIEHFVSFINPVYSLFSPHKLRSY